MSLGRVPNGVRMAAILIVTLLACASSTAGLVLLNRLTSPEFLVAGVNPRSNHSHRPRQLGGLGLLAAWLIALAAVLQTGAGVTPVVLLGLALALLALVGFFDDLKHRPILLRLAVHVVASLLALAALPELVWRGLPLLPAGAGFAISVLVLVACINIVNFMDGLDLMSVAGAGIPLGFAAIVLAGPGETGMAALLAAGAAGGLLAFAWFNRPPARLFLGDSGSLPLGLVCGLALLALQDSRGGLNGLVPFAYYAVDAISTIATRAIRLEPFWRAHSQHAYQKAYRAGMSAWWISGLVAMLSLVCGLGLVLADCAGMQGSPALAIGGAALAVALTLYFRLAGSRRTIP